MESNWERFVRRLIFIRHSNKTVKWLLEDPRSIKTKKYLTVK